LKMEPRSKCRALVGYDDSSKSVLYYSAESRKVLTSQNFKFLDPSHADPERILITPDDAVREGEPDGGMQNIVRDVSDVQLEAGPSVPRKRSVDADEDAVESTTRRRTRGKKVDYRHLNDPFSDEEVMSAEQLMNLLEGDDDDQPTLDQARRSLEWPEWERVIQSELDQLKQKGTWRLVEKPMDAVPISNKWVLTKKRDKKGNVVKYKARLVARGFTQQPGLDYDETFSPVVCFETIRALLAMVSCKKLKVCQLDVKGTYLNGILTQPIYMEQPIGFDDGSGLVCLLIKSIYGLKQAGRVWNVEFDCAICKLGFRLLISDPCTYILREGDNFVIVTVWVDDLLLFVTLDRLIERTKVGLEAEWELTNLGEPVKIIGIEIELGDHFITISQRRYLENILRKKGMEKANPVGTPLDIGITLEPNLDGNVGDRSNSYARLIGELQFLANAT
jgi:hypothetical protein